MIHGTSSTLFSELRILLQKVVLSVLQITLKTMSKQHPMNFKSNFLLILNLIHCSQVVYHSSKSYCGPLFVNFH